MMELIIQPDGSARCIYSEVISLTGLGQATINRASHVEPTKDGTWLADLSPVGGPTLGPFEKRTLALEAEVVWLRENWLVPVE